MNKKAPRTSQKTAPRTNLSWPSRKDYEAAKAAAGTIPLATHVMDVYLRAIRKREVA